MKVKMKTRYASAQGNYDIGQIVEFKKETAKALIEGNYATLVQEEVAVKAQKEKAETTPPENTSENKNKDEFKIKAFGNGLFHVVDSEGNNITDEPLPKKEAQALIKGE